jgi:hypothetical protein
MKKLFILAFLVLLLPGFVSAVTLSSSACSTFTHDRVHDLGQSVSGTNNVDVTFLPGWAQSCWTTGTVSVSENNNGPWTLLGYTDSTHQPVTTSKTFGYSGTFRYVLITDTNGACYNDCSSASVTYNDQIPEFGIVLGGVAFIGALGAVLIIRKK